MWNTPAQDSKRAAAEEDTANKGTKFSFAELFEYNSTSTSKDGEQDKTIRWTEARRFVQAAKVFLPDLTLETVFLLPRLALVDDKHDKQAERAANSNSNHKDEYRAGRGSVIADGATATAAAAAAAAAAGGAMDYSELDCFPSHSECARHLKSASWVAAKHPHAKILYVAYLSQDGVGGSDGVGEQGSAEMNRTTQQKQQQQQRQEQQQQQQEQRYTNLTTYKPGGEESEGHNCAAANIHDAAELEEARALQETRKAIYYFMVTKNFLQAHKEFAFVWVEGCCLPPYLRKHNLDGLLAGKVASAIGGGRHLDQPVACMNEFIHPMALVISDAMLIIPPVVTPARKKKLIVTTTTTTTTTTTAPTNVAEAAAPPPPSPPPPLRGKGAKGADQSTSSSSSTSPSSALSDGWSQLRATVQSGLKAITASSSSSSSTPTASTSTSTPPSLSIPSLPSTSSQPSFSTATTSTTTAVLPPPPVAVAVASATPVPSSALATATVVMNTAPSPLKPHTDLKHFLLHPWKCAEMIIGMLSGARTYVYFAYGNSHRYKLLPVPVGMPPSPPPSSSPRPALPGRRLTISSPLLGGKAKASGSGKGAGGVAGGSSGKGQAGTITTTTAITTTGGSSLVQLPPELQIQIQHHQQRYSGTGSTYEVQNSGHVFETNTTDSNASSSRNTSSGYLNSVDCNNGSGGIGGDVGDGDGGGGDVDAWGQHTCREMRESVEEVMANMELEVNTLSFANGVDGSGGGGGGGGGFTSPTKSSGKGPTRGTQVTGATSSSSLSSTLSLSQSSSSSYSSSAALPYAKAVLEPANMTTMTTSSSADVHNELAANWKAIVEPVRLLGRVHGDVSKFAAASGAIKQGVCSLTVTPSQAEEFFDSWELLRPMTLTPLADAIGRLHSLTPQFTASTPLTGNSVTGSPTTPSKGGGGTKRLNGLSPNPTAKARSKLSPKHWVGQHNNQLQLQQQQQQQQQLLVQQQLQQHQQQQQQQLEATIAIAELAAPTTAVLAPSEDDLRHQTAALNLVSFVMAFADGHVCPKRSEKQLKVLLAESLVIDDEAMEPAGGGAAGTGAGGAGPVAALHLDFWMKDLAPGDLEAMLAVLAKSSSKLTRPSNHNSTLKKLRKITVGSSHSGGDGIGPFLSAAPNLVVLELEWEGIRSIGGLATALSGHERLQKLNLTHNFIQEDGANLLAAALVMNKSLTELDLRENYIGPRGMEAIARAVPHCMNLKRLHCHENHIGDDGAIAVTEALMRSPCLSVVGLDGNGISDVGGMVLCAAIQNSMPLTSLSVKRNKFSADVKIRLRKAWKMRPRALDGQQHQRLNSDDEVDSAGGAGAGEVDDDGDDTADTDGLKTEVEDGDEEESGHGRGRQYSRSSREKFSGVIMSPVEKELRRVVNWVLDNDEAGDDEDDEDADEVADQEGGEEWVKKGGDASKLRLQQRAST